MKQQKIRQFHLAIPVKNLNESRIFYRDVLGAIEGRSTDNHIDFDFYDHHLVVHIAPPLYFTASISFQSDFHGERVQIPHFGLNFDLRTWQEIANKIKSKKYPFSDSPHIRMQNLPGEHATMFVLDPSGNALEFKAFKRHNEVFSKVFDPLTKGTDDLNRILEEVSDNNEIV